MRAVSKDFEFDIHALRLTDIRTICPDAKINNRLMYELNYMKDFKSMMFARYQRRANEKGEFDSYDSIHLADLKLEFETFDACIDSVEQSFIDASEEGVCEQYFYALDTLTSLLYLPNANIHFKQGVNLAITILEQFIGVFEDDYTQERTTDIYINYN